MATYIGFSSIRGDVAPLRVVAQVSHNFDAMLAWVRDQLAGSYWYYHSSTHARYVFMFSDGDDAFAFKLRWG